MEHNTIDGESLRAYNVPPDPLLYAFRTLSFQLGKSRTADFIDISYTPPLSQLKVINQMQLVNQSCDSWKSNIRFNLDPESEGGSTNQLLTAQFSGSFPNGCRGVNYNVVALDANTFLTQGFAAAWQTITHTKLQAEQAQHLVDLIDDSEKKLPEIAGFPVQISDMLRLGWLRVKEYQGSAYGKLYVSRVRSVLDAEHRADSNALHDVQLTREVSRWLALWMSFDDIVRVADLKSRAARTERVQREVKIKPGDVLAVYEHFKPGVPEIAGLLPKPAADRLLAWDQQRVAEGREPWAMPIKLASHTVLGTLLLRLIATFKYIRPFSSRYAEEQALIEEWLKAVTAGLAEDWQLGYELALCGRLMKGYGETNHRGRDNLLHVIRHVANDERTTATARAAAIRRAREAALTDEAGSQLDRVLKELGAPARPIKAQPIRWMQRSRHT
jgi:indolepyruvate ferredoxin oxidoreductase beta subunit